ncbi:MAG: family 1 glycosyl transferase [Bacilli bacterium]|jgi:glycosyltransferase involved in cell wall biosynthesis|nr:family 1 glycosyl transferase [Bacilli bacterium]
MKICHLTSVHPYNDIRIFVKECRSLASTGHEIHLIATNAPAGIQDRVQVHNVQPTKNGRWTRMLKTTWALYQKALEINADVYHFHDPELLPVGLLLKRKKKKVVYDVHEDVPRDILSKAWIYKPLRKVVAKIVESIENFAAKRVDAIVAATPLIAKRFQHLGCRTLNVNNYPIARELFRSESKWIDKQRAVCYIGGIVGQKGLHEMVEAIGQTDGRLLLAGSYDSEEDRRHVMNALGWENVTEYGLLNRHDVADLLSMAMAGLVVLHPLQSFIESQPIKLYEYMSAGLPIIASDFPAWRAIVEAYDCGICVDPLNPDEISQGIQWILDHPEEAERMGENGRLAIEQKFNWEKEFHTLFQLYEEMSICVG